MRVYACVCAGTYTCTHSESMVKTHQNFSGICQNKIFLFEFTCQQMSTVLCVYVHIYVDLSEKNINFLL
jgi:hypothetical protein